MARESPSLIPFSLIHVIFIADIFNTPVFKNAKNLDENLKKLGRVACIKMDNILDALCLITGLVKINLPLNNG